MNTNGSVLVEGILSPIRCACGLWLKPKKRVDGRLGVRSITHRQVLVYGKFLVVGHACKAQRDDLVGNSEDWSGKAMHVREIPAQKVFACTRVAGPAMLEPVGMRPRHEGFQRGLLEPIGCSGPGFPFGVAVSGARVFADKSPVGSNRDTQESHKGADEHNADNNRYDQFHASA